MAAARPSPLVYAVALIVAVGVAAACTTFSTDEESGPPTDAGIRETSTPDETSVSDAPADAPPPLDAGQPDGTIAIDEFYIDAMETTNAQYDAFLTRYNQSLVTAKRRATCSWKSAPGRKEGCVSNTETDAPAACIDWCDADLYCADLGKRMCGERKGGSGQKATLNDRSKSQWVRACAGVNGAQDYPYGTPGNPNNCNTQDNPMTPVTTATVGAFPKCQGSVPGLYDMSGNVLEWEDACDGDQGGGSAPDAGCYARGGSYLNPTASASCDYIAPNLLRADAKPNIGVRCCSP